MDKDQKRRELIEDIDLDQNDLEAALSNAGKLWDKGGTPVTLVILVAALGFMSYRLYTSWTTSTRENGLTELAIETSPAGFLRVANDYSAVGVRSRALLAAGDTALNLAVQLDPSREADARNEELASAQAAYDQLLASDVPAIYHVNALLGLASVAETRGEWDTAADHYARAQSVAGEDFAFLAELAASRAALLDDIRRPVAFAPPEPALPTSLDGTGLPALDNPDLEIPSLDEISPELALPPDMMERMVPGENPGDFVIPMGSPRIETIDPSTPAEESAP
ncbi:MAG: hypothetical protein AAF823_06875 [Planctomycetota bacterium]